MRFTFLSLVLSLALVACGGSSPATDAATTGDSGNAVDSGTDSGTEVDSGNDVDAHRDVDSGSSETVYSLPTGYCFTFATASSEDSMSHTCGDFLALAGFMVDLTGSGSDQFCPLTGTFTSLDEVPTSYDACAWTSYVEGAGGITNQGFIVRDVTGAHHYRMRVISNALPALSFSFDAID